MSKQMLNKAYISPFFSLYSGITDSTGKVNYSYSKSAQGTFNLKCIFNGTIGYNNSFSNVINLAIINYLFDDTCYNGTTYIRNISAVSL